MVAHYRTGNLSPVEVASSLLERIQKYDPVINAWCHLAPDETMDAARDSEERWRRGEPRGSLDGVPVAVKDVFLTRGWPTLRGSRLVDPNQAWTQDAPAVAALRRHGALLLGKTTTPELGWKGVTDSPGFGVTRNPWDPALTPGGSSGGSCAALAAGMAPLALGSDGGGSIRIPAGFTATVGFKPTWGRVPLWPVSAFGTLAHVGPLARTVSDAALLLGVLVEPDPRDAMMLPPDGADYLGGLGGGVAGLRVAYSPELGYVDFVHPEVAGAVRAAAGTFEELGALVEERDPGFADPTGAFLMLWEAGVAQATARYRPEQLALMDPGLVESAERGSRAGAVAYLDAIALRGELAVSMSLFHQHYDLLLTPTLPIPAFEAGRDVPPGWSEEQGWRSWTPFTYPFNLTQQPAISVPCGFTAAGLPIGLQLVGARGADVLVLRAAWAYEEARGLSAWPTLRPGGPKPK
ncbi:MAG: amidase [Candidatus Dormibacteria bacterium]